MLARQVPHHLADAYRALGWEIQTFIAPNHAAHAVLALWHGPEPAPEPPHRPAADAAPEPETAEGLQHRRRASRAVSARPNMEA